MWGAITKSWGAQTRGARTLGRSNRNSSYRLDVSGTIEAGLTFPVLIHFLFRPLCELRHYFRAIWDTAKDYTHGMTFIVRRYET